MMKRILSICMCLVVVLTAKAQINIPKVPDPVCALCGVDLKSNAPHKPGCRWYSPPTNDESSSSSSSSSRPSTPKTSGSTPTMPFENGRCPECGRPCKPLAYINYENIHSGCRLGEAIREYNHYSNLWIKAKKRKVRDEAWSKMQDADIKIKEVAEKALRRGYPVAQTPSYPSSTSASSSSSSSSSPSTERIKLSYECNLCKASVMAYSINEASKEFADNPWLHKPTCQSYKPKPGQNPSTSLKDYTPASEHPMVSEPLIDMPVCETSPQFSSINESNIRYEKPASLTGKHQWGEIDEAATLAYFKKINHGRPISFQDLKYDIERYNHAGGPVVIGIHQPNGRYSWYVFSRQSNGKFAPVDDNINNQTWWTTDRFGRDVKAQTVDVRYEGLGRLVVREYEGGEKFIYNTSGKIITSGRKVSLVQHAVDGKLLVYSEPDEEGGSYRIIDENGHSVASGNSIETYNDAIVVMNDIKGEKRFSISNWRGEELRIDGFKFFDGIKAYNNEGSYYLLKDNEKGYAVIGRGFRRVGEWYDTEEEAHRAWRDYHPRP